MPSHKSTRGHHNSGGMDANGTDSGSMIESMYVIRGVEYVVSLSASDESMVVEVEDKTTSEQWRDEFDSAYIEDLTHKTGNYKQYGVFVSMLESAIAQSSESVYLDLLTYSDLESLRKQKSGGNIKHSAAPSHALGSKRYLILTYTVEFDRIHYPLPLPYMGTPDPRVLQETIRELQQEISHLKSHDNRGLSWKKDYEKLKKEFTKLLEEKEEVEIAFGEYQREIEQTQTGVLAKDLRLIKDVVRNLEEDLLKERSDHQRATMKRSKEVKDLHAELDECRANERNLRVRVKSLTSELALYRRKGSRAFPNSAPAGSSSSYRSHTSSRENSFSRRDNSRLSHNSSRLSSSSVNRSHDHSGHSKRSGDRSWDRGRSGSRDRTLQRQASRERPRSRTPSPAPAPRFNPTAFIKEKERQKKETELRRARQARTGRSSSREYRRPPSVCSDNSYGSRRNLSRSPSVGSIRSRTSSIESLLSDIPVASDSDTRNVGRSRNSRATRKSSQGRQLKPPLRTSKKILSSTPEQLPRTKSRTQPAASNHSKHSRDGDAFDRSSEISDIDARLSRLQQFMKANLPMPS